MSGPIQLSPDHPGSGHRRRLQPRDGLLLVTEDLLTTLTDDSFAIAEESSEFGPSDDFAPDDAQAQRFLQFQRRKRAAEAVDAGATVAQALEANPGTGADESWFRDMLRRRDAEHSDNVLMAYGTREPHGSFVSPKLQAEVRHLLRLNFGTTTMRKHPRLVRRASELHEPVPTRDQILYIKNHSPKTHGHKVPGSRSTYSIGTSSVDRRVYDGRAYAKIEIDGERMNVKAQTEEGSALTLRPVAYLGTDICLHMPVGFDILPAEGDQFDASELVQQMILPKDEICAACGTENSWLAYGIPDRVATDRGRELTSKLMRRMTWLIGFVLENVPAREPWRKPFAEQMNREIQEGSDHLGVSTTLNSPFALGDGDSHRAAVMHNVTIPAVERKTIRHIVDLHNRVFHPGSHGSPNDAWRRSLDRFGPPRTWLDTPAHLRAQAKFEFASKTVTKNGVWVAGHWLKEAPERDASESAEDSPLSVPPGARPRWLAKLMARKVRVFGRIDDLRWVELCNRRGDRLAIAVCHDCQALRRPVPLWEIEEMRREERRLEQEANEAQAEKTAKVHQESPRGRMRRSGGRTKREVRDAQRHARAVRNQPDLLEEPFAPPVLAQSARVPSKRTRPAEKLQVID